jgi:hypothetical protein
MDKPVPRFVHSCRMKIAFCFVQSQCGIFVCNRDEWRILHREKLFRDLLQSFNKDITGLNM